MRESAPSAQDPLVQGPNDPCGNPPYIPSLERHLIEVAGLAEEDAAVLAVIFRAHQEGKRHFESLLDLAGVEPETKARVDPPKDRDNAVACPREIGIEIADQTDQLWHESDLLLRLAQRGSTGI